MKLKVTQNGKKLDPSLYTWDKDKKIFESSENNLVIDCPFDDCTFKTGSFCIFKTGYCCTFKTGSYCTFDTESDCTFETGFDCTFKTGFSCTFKTGFSCTFKTGSDCTFTSDENCVVIRRDIFEVIKLRKNVKTKLNGFQVKGYTLIKK